MKTPKTKINVDEGTLSIEFNNEIVEFLIFDISNDDNSVVSPLSSIDRKNWV